MNYNNLPEETEKRLEQSNKPQPEKSEIASMLASVNNYLSSFAKTGKDHEKIINILNAMIFIDRKFFVKEEKQAYVDAALLVGAGQTISQPSTVARMLMLAGLEHGMDVLEVGSGSGWNACLIQHLVRPGKLTTVERINLLLEKARLNTREMIKELEQGNKEMKQEAESLKKIDYRSENVFKMRADKSGDRFDRIIITAGIMQKQKKQLDQLAENLLKMNGMLICPYLSGPILIIRKQADGLKTSYTQEHYAFVPLVE